MPSEVQCIVVALEHQSFLICKFSYLIHNLNTLYYCLCLVTADGLYELSQVHLLTRASRPLYSLVLRGSFFGLDVMGMETEFPIVLTTTKTNHCCYLEMRGKRYTISAEAGLLTQITQPDARSSQRFLFLALTPLSWEGPTSPRSASIHPARYVTQLNLKN